MLDLVEIVQPRAEAAMRALAQMSVERVQESLSVQGHVRPFVASAPGEPPMKWGSELIDGIQWFMEEYGGEFYTSFYVVSNGIDPFTGYNFAADEEGGHWWGDERGAWARDFERGNEWVWCGPAHYVEPRPYMRPEVIRLAESGLSTLAGVMAAASA